MDSNQHIYLTGYRGTGKTSVGKILAKQLQRPFVDLDDVVESSAGRAIREIFEVGGESAFRDLETTCLEDVAARAAASGGEVVALGGGAILREQNRGVIDGSGVCIWLDAAAEVLAGRINDDESTARRRPALTNLGQMDEIHSLLTQREPLYRSASHHRIDTAEKTPQAIAAEIQEWLKEY